MQSLHGFGDWLKGAAKVPWGKLAEKSISVTKATADLGKTWQEAAPKIEALKDLDRINSFFQLLDLPVAKLAVSTLPFASVGIELLRLYWDVTKTEPTFESSVALAAQMAYLESLQGVLARADKQTQAALEKVRLSDVFERQLKKSELISLNKVRAKKTLTQLRKSELAEAFDEALGELLTAAGLADWQVRVLVDQVAWGTPKYFHGVVAELKDEVEPLAEFLRTDGLRVQEKFDDIEDYLEKKIRPLPYQQVFDETRVTFDDLYVPLTVQPLDISGKEAGEAPVGINDWAIALIEKTEPRKVGFLEGDAGRGKSVFCRMLAESVATRLYPSFIPILIRLREVRVLENNLAQTLETHLETQDFVQSDRGGWLTDINTRFLLIFDGFDELLLQGRESGGLKELIQQLCDFQRDSHHQCLVTGRPLALQGVDRVLTQTNNLVRVRLEPMADEQRNEWLVSWAKLFGEEEANGFKEFLTACPNDISEQLAREPLLLYMLGRLHRENHLNAQMFAGAEGIQAKVRVYDESVKWVLERQRQELNDRISGLKTEDLRQVLQEAALCVVQSGNEMAKLTMLKSRFTDSTNPVAELLKQAQREAEKTEDKALNNLLTAFYLKPGEGDKTGSVEFAHKSFGEFLFAERLKRAFEDWVEVDRRGRFRLNDGEVAKQIYDLLGYGSLTAEVVDYLQEKLFSVARLPDLVLLFQRLKQFYEQWCEGAFIDSVPSENWPQIKMAQMGAAEINRGLRQVDIHAGLNALRLLFVLHRYGQAQVKAGKSSPLHFHPCERPSLDEMDRENLLRMIGYSQLVGLDYFTQTVGLHLHSANLRNASLRSTNLHSADLSYANLENASFRSANLRYVDLSYANLIDADLIDTALCSANLCSADLSYANLINADLSDANLSSANLSSANLIDANLDNARFDEKTNWEGVIGLNTARNVPDVLKQQLGLT